MIVRRRDVTRWYYLLNTVRGRLILVTLFLEFITFLMLSMDPNDSTNSAQNKLTAKHRNYPQSPFMPVPEALVAAGKLNFMEDVEEAESNVLIDGSYKYEKYEHLPDVEKEFERRMNPKKLDKEVQDRPEDHNEDAYKSVVAIRKTRSHSSEEGIVVVVEPHKFIDAFLWVMFLIFYVFNFFVTLGMAYIRMFLRVDKNTSKLMWSITLILDVLLIVLAVIAMATGAVSESVSIMLLGAVILVFNSVLPVDDWQSIFNWFQFHCVMMFHHPPHVPQNPAPHHPFNPAPNLPLNPPPNVSLDSQSNLQPGSPPSLLPSPLLNSTEISAPNSPPLVNEEGVDQAKAGPSGINDTAQPRHSDIDLGDNGNSDQSVDIGDIGPRNPKVRFAIENENSSDCIVTYVPGRNSPIATISKSVILQYKGNTAQQGECVHNRELVSLEQEGQPISLEKEQQEYLLGLCIEISLTQLEGNNEHSENGRSNVTENCPKQKSRNLGETKNKLPKDQTCRSNNNGNQLTRAGVSISVDKNGKETVGKNGKETVGKNGKEAVGNNGKEAVGNNGKVAVGNNGKEAVGNNGKEAVGNNGKEAVGNNGREAVGNNGKEAVGNNGKEAVGNNGKEAFGNYGKEADENEAVGNNGMKLLETMETKLLDTIETKLLDTIETKLLDTIETKHLEAVETKHLEAVETKHLETMETKM